MRVSDTKRQSKVRGGSPFYKTRFMAFNNLVGKLALIVELAAARCYRD